MFVGVDNWCCYSFKLWKWVAWVIIACVFTFTLIFNRLIRKVRFIIDLWIDKTLASLITIAVQTCPSLRTCKPLSTFSLFYSNDSIYFFQRVVLWFFLQPLKSAGTMSSAFRFPSWKNSPALGVFYLWKPFFFCHLLAEKTSRKSALRFEVRGFFEFLVE